MDAQPVAIDLLLTAKRVADGMPWYFVRDNPKNSRCTGGLSLVDCATASAAAPTYFEPWTISQAKAGCDVPGTLVDSGVGVTGNPVYQACVEAFYYNDAFQPDQTTVVSLGTGRYAGKADTPGSLLGWLRWTVAELLRSPEEQQTQIVRRHFDKIKFFRFDLALKEDIDMDYVGSIDRLRQYGEEFAAQIDWQAVLAN